MRKRQYIYFLIISILFTGCAASKTELAKINVDSMKNSALVIGTFSRNLGKDYIASNSITILNEKKEFVTVIRETASESLSLGGNPYEYKNDFINKDSQSSIFAITLPQGKYYVTNYFAGRGMGGFTGQYYKKINLKSGEIVYLGDIKFVPVLETHPLYKTKKNIVSANCIISNHLDRDFKHFKKLYPDSFFNRNKIIINTEENSFNLGSFHSDANPMMLFLPPML